MDGNEGRPLKLDQYGKPLWEVTKTVTTETFQTLLVDMGYTLKNGYNGTSLPSQN